MSECTEDVCRAAVVSAFSFFGFRLVYTLLARAA